jgi:hypothetical protein
VDLEERETQCLVVVGGKFLDREIEEPFSSSGRGRRKDPLSGHA